MSDDQDTFISLGEAVRQVIDSLTQKFEERHGPYSYHQTGILDIGAGDGVFDERSPAVHRDMELL